MRALLLRPSPRRAFLRGALAGPQSWYARSLAILSERGIPDWPSWAGPTTSVDAYVALCRRRLEATCRAAWMLEADRHVDPVRYDEVRPADGGGLLTLCSLGLDWQVPRVGK